MKQANEGQGHLNDAIESIIAAPQYQRSQQEKEKILLPILKQQLSLARRNKYMESFYKKMGVRIMELSRINELPFLPVSMFKHYKLQLVTDEEIIRILKSSGTGEQGQSSIPIDKVTALRQSKALSSLFIQYFGKKRFPMLIMDTASSQKAQDRSITARGAAIRGFSNFAKEIVYGLKTANGSLEPDMEALGAFYKKYAKDEVLVFGFTYIIWEHFINHLKDKKKFRFKGIKILHGGGWKRLIDRQVTKEVFSRTVADIFSCREQDVLDYYGMVEETGIVFIDCEEGNKHVPDFADIIIRNPFTLNEEKKGKPGLIEILSILPNSYPGFAVLTEDIGKVVGIDDCACGRKGKYFQFIARVEKTETRGCGDTFEVP